MAAPLGNQNARKAKLWRDSIIRELDRRTAEGESQESAIDAMARKLIDLCIEGDLEAIKELGNRLDGRPAQSVTVSGEEGAPPIAVKGIVELVRPG